MPTISDVRHALVYYDTNTMSLLLWDGTVSGGPSGGGLTDAELRASAVPVSVAALAFENGTDLKVAAVQQEGASFAVSGGFSADAIAANAGAVFMPTLPVAANAADPTLTEGMLNPLSMDLAGNLRVRSLRSATGTTTAVSDTATTTTLLASNANRRGASIANDSSAALYVKLGATASLTSYAARVAQYGLYEVPFNYTGIIDGIWATDPNDGAARIVEFT